MIDKKDILKLKKITLLGLEKCQKALTEANGDFEKALQILRKQGEKIAAKRVGRTMEEGRIFAGLNADKKSGVILALGSETDFAAKSETFKTLGDALVKCALEKGFTVAEDLLAAPYGQHTFQEEITQIAGGLRENISLIDYQYIQAPVVGFYVHTGYKLGGMVALNMAECNGEALAEVARNFAMQVVISDPFSIDEKNFPEKELSNEKEAITAKLSKKALPADKIDSIVERALAKFVKENILIAQTFIQDEEKTVGEYMTAISSAIQITQFKRVQIGLL